MSSPAIPVVTAGLRPDLFGAEGVHSLNRRLLVVILSMLVVIGFGFRVSGLNAEGLSEDELNKLNAVADYRAHGITSANGEHPFVMKVLLTISVIGAEKWNQTSWAAANPALKVPAESALRLPGAVFGALSIALLFLIASELFGVEIGLLAAALWTFDPLTIGFNRIAKEDTFLVFFFLLANVFWLRSQRIAESHERQPELLYWATAVSFGAMIASKYVPQMLVVSLAYYYTFQAIPETRWRLKKKRFLIFFSLIGVSFLFFNPPIFLPGTWRAIFSFANYKSLGHDSYEFMGRLYSHRVTDWLKGEPWYFYLVLIAVKEPLLVLLGFILGAGALLRKQCGDGRYFLFFWFFSWTLVFIFAGGKFTRYSTSLLPAIMITAAIGIHLAARAFAGLCARLAGNKRVKLLARAVLAMTVIISALWSTADAWPHYRLHMNALGGAGSAGFYFPQDEFYDAYMRDALNEIARRARPGARVASELPTVSVYYAQQANRSDLICLNLSDPNDLQKLTSDDFVIDGQGRTYFSNQAMLLRLRKVSRPAFTISVGATPAADVYVMDQNALEALRGTAQR